MENKKVILNRGLVSVLVFIFVSFESVSTASNLRTITLKWTSPVFEEIFEPNSRFMPGKPVSNIVLKKEANNWCANRFGFSQMSIFSASRTLMGTTSNKTIKSKSTVISGIWRENEFGEDEFSISIKCTGSMSAPIKAKSKHYSLTIYYVYYEPITKKYWKDSYVTSPNFTLFDLDDNQSTVNLRIVYDENGDPEMSSDAHIWSPAGNWGS
ncbi:unannotated protein [freshwater metagenome]|uniref:Unannotated protein n=1 Tax=freshwater metagenome TaxID=449393 RepID=A0A6J6EEC7_9ZZZZ|nr:hypothetical protein [Actinomycetota bacterium]